VLEDRRIEIHDPPASIITAVAVTIFVIENHRNVVWAVTAGGCGYRPDHW
jgi:hypothetical protein